MMLERAIERLHDFDRDILGIPDSGNIPAKTPLQIDIRNYPMGIIALEHLTRIVCEECPKREVDPMVDEVVIPVGRMNLENEDLPDFVKTLFGENQDVEKSNGLAIAVIRISNDNFVFLYELDTANGWKNWAYIQASGDEMSLFVNVNATNRTDENETYQMANSEIFDGLFNIQNPEEKERANLRAASQILAFIRSRVGEYVSTSAAEAAH